MWTPHSDPRVFPTFSCGSPTESSLRCFLLSYKVIILRHLLIFHSHFLDVSQTQTNFYILAAVSTQAIKIGMGFRMGTGAKLLLTQGVTVLSFQIVAW